jgi:hypothetical protein
MHAAGREPFCTGNQQCRFRCEALHTMDITFERGIFGRSVNNKLKREYTNLPLPHSQLAILLHAVYMIKLYVYILLLHLKDRPTDRPTVHAASTLDAVQRPFLHLHKLCTVEILIGGMSELSQ